MTESLEGIYYFTFSDEKNIECLLIKIEGLFCICPWQDINEYSQMDIL